MFQTLLTSEVSGQLWNTCAWDLHSGTTRVTYKGGSSAPHCLCVVAGRAVISATVNKPLIHVWPIHKVSGDFICIRSTLRWDTPGEIVFYWLFE